MLWFMLFFMINGLAIPLALYEQFIHWSFHKYYHYFFHLRKHGVNNTFLPLFGSSGPLKITLLRLIAFLMGSGWAPGPMSWLSFWQFYWKFCHEKSSAFPISIILLGIFLESKVFFLFSFPFSSDFFSLAFRISLTEVLLSFSLCQIDKAFKSTDWQTYFSLVPNKAENFPFDSLGFLCAVSPKWVLRSIWWKRNAERRSD